MSAILSADDLNDFISPGVACIKPVETLPAQRPDNEKTINPYEVTTEEQLATQPGGNAAPNAQISLTDCLACSGCVTSAEAILVSLQSHEEVLSTLESHPELSWQEARDQADSGEDSGRIFVATISPQTRASIAATYGVSEWEAGNMIEHLLRGPQGLKSGGRHGSGFTWVLDTNTTREMCHEAGVQEVLDTLESDAQSDGPKKPVLASSCPGWICYAEKTHPYVLPHLSRLKSPQAMTGTLVKSVLSRRFGVAPDKVWHVAVMPCFDKKLEASREELTDVWWRPGATEKRGVRDVDCVITARELVMLADSRNISMPNLPRTPVKVQQPPFPDAGVDAFLFPHGRRRPLYQGVSGGTSGGYAHHVLEAVQIKNPGSQIRIVRGRNVDVVEYILVRGEETLLKTARYYGFRNIQNLVRGLKPAKASRLPGSRFNRRAEANGGARAGGVHDYAYVEVMACPGGCTNGGGQIKATDVAGLRGLAAPETKTGLAEQKQWLAQVDEAYYSADSESETSADAMDVDQEPPSLKGVDVKQAMEHWASITGIEIDKLVLTSYRAVESDVGKAKPKDDMEHVAGLAASIGGGW